MRYPLFLCSVLTVAMQDANAASQFLPKGSLLCKNASLMHQIGQGDYRAIRECKVSRVDMMVEVMTTMDTGSAEVYVPATKAKAYVQRDALK